MSVPGAPPPSTDAALVRFLDGECDGAERSAIASLAVHEDAFQRLRTLERASVAFAEAAATLDPPPLPARRRPARRIEPRAAAAILLIAAGTAAAAVPPARDAITRGVADLAAWILHGGGAPAPPVDPGATSVSFRPEGASFELVIDHAQVSGALVLSRTDGERARARAPADTELVVLPATLQVRNRPDGTGDVLVELPAAVERVHVRIGLIERTVVLSDDAPAVTLPLRGAPGSTP